MGQWWLVTTAIPLAIATLVVGVMMVMNSGVNFFFFVLILNINFCLLNLIKEYVVIQHLTYKRGKFYQVIIYNLHVKYMIRFLFFFEKKKMHS